jgi:hypothetical protein
VHPALPVVASLPSSPSSFASLVIDPDPFPEIHDTEASIHVHVAGKTKHKSAKHKSSLPTMSQARLSYHACSDEPAHVTHDNHDDHPYAPLVINCLKQDGDSTHALLVFDATILGKSVRVCIDSGASANFISLDLAQHLRLSSKKLLGDPLDVTLADGSLQHTSYVFQVPFRMSTYAATCSAYGTVLAGSMHLILGMPWLAYTNPNINWMQGTMVFSTKGRRHRLVSTPYSADRNPTCDGLTLSALQLKRASRKGASVFAILLKEMDPDDDNSDPNPGPTELSFCAPEFSSLVSEFSDVFQPPPKGLPPERSVVHTIPIEPGARPPTRPIYPMSQPELAELKRQLDELIEKGYIEPSTSPYSAPILFVKKKTGELRMCIDYRGLNKITIKNKYPLPHISELLDRLDRVEYVSSIDLNSAYYQVRVAEQDISKTAFSCRYGHFQFRVMPFGLTSAPSTFQRLVNDVFRQHLDDFVVTYLDDILVFSKSAKEHAAHLRIVFALLRKHKLYAKASKCQLGCESLPFLGHIVGRNGIAMDPAKVKAVQDWPTPSNVHHVRAFLGLSGFYRRFVKNYSLVASPLTDLLQLGKPFSWGSHEQSAFVALKSALVSAPILSAPDFSREFHLELTTDASDFAIGAVLSQGTKENLRTIAYLSHKLSGAQLNYPVHEKEMYAIIRALQSWRHYLLSGPFTIMTDHKGLEYIQTTKNLTGRRARWAQLMDEFDYSIKYITGKSNVVADALSRRPDLRLHLLLGHVTLDQADVVLTLHNDLMAANASDEFYLATSPTASDPNSKFILGHDKLLYFLSPNGPRLYIPASLRDVVMHEAHDTVSSGHLGMDKTLSALARRFYWPSMEKSVRLYVRTCVSCQRNKSEQKKLAGLLSPNPIPDKPWSHVTMDFITELPVSNGYDSILTIVDRLTKMVHFHPCSSTITAPQAAQAFIQSVFRLHGLPSVIYSDRDPKFRGNFWKSLFKLLGTKLNMSTARHPQTDGQSERANRSIEEMLRHYINPSLTDWFDHLPLLEFAYNSSVQASTGATPFYLNFGQHPMSVLDVALPSTLAGMSDSAESTISRIRDSVTKAQLHLQHAQDRMVRYANKNRRDLKFSVDDLVLLSSDGLKPPSASDQARKFQPKFYGPFRVLEVRNNSLNYVLDLPAHWKCHNVFHVSKLRPFHSDDRHHVPPQTVNVDGQEEFFVRSILKHRPEHSSRATATHFLVEWEGYPLEDATWEPLKHVVDTVAYDTYLKGAPSRQPRRKSRK